MTTINTDKLNIAQNLAQSAAQLHSVGLLTLSDAFAQAAKRLLAEAIQEDQHGATAVS